MSKKKRVQPVKKSNLTAVYVALAVLVIVGLIIYISASPSPRNNSTTTFSGKFPTSGKFINISKPSTYEPGKVKIIEFLKFNCGHCYQLNQQMPAIKEKYGDKLEITYKPMLWRTVKGDASFRKSIEAYILAERMGKGEEMKDALFNAMFIDKKDLTSEIVLEDIAKSVGLGENFSTALKNGDAKDEAEANIKLAESFQVEETPTLIINGNMKVTPTLIGGDIVKMAANLDEITGSLLS